MVALTSALIGVVALSAAPVPPPAERAVVNESLVAPEHDNAWGLFVAEASPDLLAELVGEWPYPPAPLGLPRRATVAIAREGGHLVATTPVSGTFKHYLQPDGRLLEEDSLELYRPIRDADGRFAGLADADAIVGAALAAAVKDREQAAATLALLDGEEDAQVEVARVVLAVLGGQGEEAERRARALSTRVHPSEVEGRFNAAGYTLLQAGHPTEAREVFALNTRLSPDRANPWDSLGEAHMVLGNDAEAIRCYEKSLELDPKNENARRMIATVRGKAE